MMTNKTDRGTQGIDNPRGRAARNWAWATWATGSGQATRVRVGDIVRVRPKNPLAVGRGVGVITHVGQMFIGVNFFRLHPERSIACLASDCELLSTQEKE
jgi:hypothetical protein